MPSLGTSRGREATVSKDALRISLTLIYGGPQVSRQNIKEASQQKLSRQKFVKATQKFVNNAAKVYESHGKSL